MTPDRPVKALGSVGLAAGEPIPPTGVRRVEAATTATTRQASSVNVAIIDTGIDLTHPDLQAVNGTNCVSPGAPAQDDNGHGTHLAGTVGARNNGTGVTGVAPGTTVYAVKVLNAAGTGRESQFICGVDWVTANAARLNIKVANVSLGGPAGTLDSCPFTSDAEHVAICNSIAAGVTYAVAAGNSSSPFRCPGCGLRTRRLSRGADRDRHVRQRGAPGAAAAPPSCRAGESDDRYAGFSNYAITASGGAHAIAAPGVCIRSTWPGGGYNTISGTSMATPHVAGAIALCLGEAGYAGPCTGLTPAQIVQKLRTEVEDHTTSTTGYGFSGDPARPVSGRYYGYLQWNPPSPPQPASERRTGNFDADAKTDMAVW